MVLGLANGTTPLKRDQIPDLEFVLWVMRLEFPHHTHALLVLWIDAVAYRSDIHGLVVGGAYDLPVDRFQSDDSGVDRLAGARQRLDEGKREIGEKRRLEKWN